MSSLNSLLQFRTSSPRCAFSFLLFLSVSQFIISGDEALPGSGSHQHERSTFEQQHMKADKHNVEMDHKAILGLKLEECKFD